MSLSKADKNKFLREAETYESMRDSLGRDYLENFKFVKSQLADWYIALAAVCFAIGGIAISLGKSNVVHPALFWWGSVLLIANGVFIFFVRKTELESESSGFSNLKQKEADLWTMGKIAREHADGDESRALEFKLVTERFTSDYDRSSKPRKWWQWVRFVFYACMLDVVFGLFLFPVLLLASQLPNYMHITFRTYSLLLWILLFLYIIYTVLQGFKAVKEKKRSDVAHRQIKAEVDKR